MKTLALLAGILLLSPTASAQDNEIPIKDFGEREKGQTYNLKLTAQNINCENPQDFEFELEGLPWIITDNPAIARGLGPGQSQTIPATMDFQYTPVGTHYGRLTSRCLTCGWFIFASCMDQGQDIVFKVTVTDPANPDAKLPKVRNPYAGMAPTVTIDVALGPRLSDQDIKVLTETQKTDLKRTRGALTQAEKAGEQAQADLRKAQRAKSDCERELAWLKALAKDAKRKADIAKQDVKNAEGAAKEAAKTLKSFERDNRKAFQQIEITKNNTLTAAKYRSIVAEEDGTDSERYRRAQEQVDDFNQKHFEALKTHSAVSKSHEAREAAANEAARQVEIEQQKAEAAKAAADAAQAKYEAQLKICKGRDDAIKMAQDKVDDAKDNARKAAKAANKAEGQAALQANDALKDKIKAHKKKCKVSRRNAEKELDKLLRALDAGQKLGILQADGKRKPSSIKKINDQIWDAAEDLAQDTAKITVTDPDKFNSADAAEDALESVTEIMGYAAEAFQSAVGGTGVSDFSQAQLLGGVKALGYAVQSLVAAGRHPQSNYTLRDEASRGDDSRLSQDMKAKNIGKDAADRKMLKELIAKLHSKPNYIAEYVERTAQHAAKCAAEIRKLEAQREALKEQFDAGSQKNRALIGVGLNLVKF